MIEKAIGGSDRCHTCAAHCVVIEDLEIALAAANELCERYETAIRKLGNEVGGSLYMDEREMRALIGNTNFDCIKLRLDEAKALLGTFKPGEKP